MFEQRSALADAAPSRQRLVLEDYFLGPTRAWGIFQDRFGNLRRQFKVTIDGRWDGRDLVLTEDFLYDDQSIDHRVWRIRKQDDARYQAVANDVVGLASGTASGSSFSWIYDFRLKLGSRIVVVRFDDRMYLQDARTLITRTRVSKIGIEIGQISMFFRKS
ncbi:MAG TPA: DUF3833 family protein [Aliidongia sp.]|uniref:DUF3833 family protein n=1 Tax=Aliidongia sp. TaxID=1914230 RepID=UPI002DDD9AD3|nr:DUF3833 family protein [Aliidongia sp.]HEV2675453.1 DUF3833 family protein [Aliidongia sp.]